MSRYSEVYDMILDHLNSYYEESRMRNRDYVIESHLVPVFGMISDDPSIEGTELMIRFLDRILLKGERQDFDIDTSKKISIPSASKDILSAFRQGLDRDDFDDDFKIEINKYIMEIKPEIEDSIGWGFGGKTEKIESRLKSNLLKRMGKKSLTTNNINKNSVLSVGDTMKLDINKLINIANNLDEAGLTKEADEIDLIIRKFSELVPLNKQRNMSFDSYVQDVADDDFSDLIEAEEEYDKKFQMLSSDSRDDLEPDEDLEYGDVDEFSYTDEDLDEDFESAMSPIDELEFDISSPEQEAVSRISDKNKFTISYDLLEEASNSVGLTPKEFLSKMGFEDEEIENLIMKSKEKNHGLYFEDGLSGHDLLRKSKKRKINEFNDIENEAMDVESNIDDDGFLEYEDLSNLWNE